MVVGTPLSPADTGSLSTDETALDAWGSIGATGGELGRQPASISGTNIAKQMKKRMVCTHQHSTTTNAYRQRRQLSSQFVQENCTDPPPVVESLTKIYQSATFKERQGQLSVSQVVCSPERFEETPAT